ncbi:MAG: ABC transporter permease [Candidatus Taylorbacteria bacterium]|nr:ABC transporter permease [Candidatus Taylorbacteria bacterium]
MTTIIKPKKTFSLEDFREVWRYKELLYFFVWRDIKVKYKQTIVGIGWAVFQPFMTMVVFSVFFGKLIQVPSDGIPYPIFVYTGLLFWQLFSSSLGDASNSLIANATIVTKVYFPRIILPLAGTANQFVDLFFASLALIFLMFYYGYTPELSGLLLIPMLLAITSATAVGAGLVLASINVKYRDVRYVLPFFMQLLLFLTPVIYPSSIAGKYAWLLSFNPMTGVIKAARSGLLGTEPIVWYSLGASALAAVILLTAGIFFFKKTERYFADIV